MNNPTYSKKHIERQIKSFLPNANVTINHINGTFKYVADVEFNNNSFGIEFIEDILEALESSKKNEESDETTYLAMCSTVDFIVYLALGKKGLVNDFEISREFLKEEKRNWVSTNYSKDDLEFEGNINMIFYKGLLNLESFLHKLINTTGTKNASIINEHNISVGLISRYKKNKSFNRILLNGEDLGFLRASAIIKVIELEKDRKSTNIQRIKDDKNKEIYDIVAELREPHFVNVKLPNCIHDYVNNLGLLNKEINALGTEKKAIPEGDDKVDSWKQIEKEYGINKKVLGVKIGFVKDRFKRNIIFRDIEQAYRLIGLGFNKPALVLSGGVIEELLRLYLEYKGINTSHKTFNKYIEICENKHLLKDPIRHMSNATRYFRNSVHLKEESSSKDTISKANAIRAFASIFIIVNDFEKHD